MDFTVRPFAREELPLVAASFPLRGLPHAHDQRLAAQERGEATYFAAWRAGSAVGLALARWTGPIEADFGPLLQHLGAHPYVEGLAVLEQHRSAGIGTSIMQTIEAAAVGRGCSRVGLAVGVDNYAAQRFYKRIGYEDAGIGQFQVTWPFVGPNGESGVEGETCIYMLKELDPSQL